MPRPDPATLGPHAVEVRAGFGCPWEVAAVAPDRAGAVERLRELIRSHGADRVRVAPVRLPPTPKAPRLDADQRAALLHALAGRALATQPLAVALADGGARSVATRRRTSETIRRLRELGLVRDAGDGTHALTVEGRAVAATLGTPPHDAASDERQ